MRSLFDCFDILCVLYIMYASEHVLINVLLGVCCLFVVCVYVLGAACDDILEGLGWVVLPWRTDGDP